MLATFSESYWTGWPFNLVNGNYYISNQVPKSYLFLNIFFKSPEYILLCYLFFAIVFIKSRKFFQDRFILFNYKILLIIIILVFPNIVLFFIPYPLYDGVRLFLWTLPYICIIPGLLIYYLIENFRYKIHKISLAFLSFFILYFLFYFFAITPYQYTYLNIFNGQKETRFKKFENDYWGASLKELINNTDFKTDKTLNLAVCGVNPIIAEFYLKKKVQNNINFVNASDADFFIMTNRVVMENDQTDASPKLINCFDKFKGNDISKVERNGLILSLIRKKI